MTTANPNRRVLWAGLLLILAAFSTNAQEFRGVVAGKITDPNGAVVPGSKVEIKNMETGCRRNIQMEAGRSSIQTRLAIRNASRSTMAR